MVRIGSVTAILGTLRRTMVAQQEVAEMRFLCGVPGLIIWEGVRGPEIQSSV